MKFTKDEQLDIGRRMYNKEITYQEAMNLYNISESCAHKYMLSESTDKESGRKVKECNKIIIQIVIAIIGAVAGLLGVNAFYQYVLMNLPLVVRMVLMIVTYWSIALVPFCRNTTEYKSKICICAKGVFRSARLKIL